MTRHFLPVLCAFLLACNPNDSEKNSTGKGALETAMHTPETVSDVEPGLRKADSLQVIYYDDPDGDSLRYTRFFTYTETADTALVKSLVAEMADKVYIQEPKARGCRSEGKLYLLNGEEIIKTVYFSTRGDSCRYFYFIKDGTFVYFPLSVGAEAWLKERRLEAKKP